MMNDNLSARQAYEEIERRPWYRIIGYRSALSAILLFGVLAFLLIKKIAEGNLASWTGVLVSLMTVVLVGLAIRDILEWRRERARVRAQLTADRSD